ncbi:MAG TPA: type III-B CRISPR-associated protein Cas10/Cmr2 [Blastocatellia bacterium]
MNNERANVYIAADVDRVQEYVFESAKLAEMRGASLILDLLNVKDSDDDKWGDVTIEGRKVKGLPQILEELGLADDCLIFKGGGSALIKVAREKAEDVKRRIEELYVRTTLTATITVVSEPEVSFDPEWFSTKASQAKGEAWRLLKDNIVDEERWNSCSSYADLKQTDFDRAQTFGHKQSALGYALRRAKQRKSTAPIFEVSPFTERCAYCHLRPAITLAREIDERPICEVCRRKRQDRGEHLAHSFYLKRFWEYIEKEAERDNWLPYLKGLREDKELAQWTDVESARDLEGIAKAARNKKDNFIGIIYADGNNMGDAIDRIEKEEDFGEFAKEVREIVEQAVFSGLGNLLDGHREGRREYLDSSRQKQERTYRYHPFEIISIGGDDVYLFVPADVALEMALRICSEFEESCGKSQNRYVQGLTLAAGVLIAHVTTPVYFSRNIVKGLLKNAKRLSKMNKPPISAIDFQVITADTAITEDVKAFREQAYRNRFRDEGLTARPLRLEEVKRLIDIARELRKESFPKSQLHALRDAVVRGPQPRATNYYYYQRSRNSRMKEQYEPLHRFFMSEAKSDRHLPFWTTDDNRYDTKLVTPRAGACAGLSGRYDDNRYDTKLVTRLVDLIEIYDFVRPAANDKEG